MLTVSGGSAVQVDRGVVGASGDGESGATGLPSVAGPIWAVGGLVLLLGAVLGLREVATLVLPVLVGLLIALVAWPMVGALERRGVRHGLALAGTVTVVLAMVFLAAGIGALAVGELVVQVPRYESRLGAALPDLRDRLAQFGITVDLGAISAVISPERIVAFVQPVASAVSEAGGAMLVVAFTVIYSLAGARSLRSRATAALGEGHPYLLGVDRFGTDLRRYLVVRTKLGLFAAVTSLALLVVLGVPLPVLWAVLVFIASFIPNVGTVIALIPPTILAYLDGSVGLALAVVMGYGLINLVQDQFLQPLAMGSELNLSPLVIFIAVIVWAWIFGPAGALLAVPLTVGLVMILEAFPSSRGLASLLRNSVEPPSRSVA